MTAVQTIQSSLERVLRQRLNHPVAAPRTRSAEEQTEMETLTDGSRREGTGIARGPCQRARPRRNPRRG